MPLPAKITVEVLPVIDLGAELGAGADADAAYELVTGRMQDALDELAARFFAAVSDGAAGSVTPLVRRPVVIEAPSNLGLSPPEPGSVPGVYKLAGALRECRLPARIAASDGGVVVPPRYRADWDGQTVRNREAIASYSPRLPDRFTATLYGGGFPVVLGCDCSILLGAMNALRRRGRYGLVFVDGHLDFRHNGN